MGNQLPDGRYQIKALNTASLLTDSNGTLVATPNWGAADANQVWELTNLNDGTVTLRCEGSSNYLTMAEREGLYYTSALEPHPWRIEPSTKGGGYDLVRVASERRIWLSGLLIDPKPVFLQGVEQDVIPTRWTFIPA